jgi:RNA polymerase sigma-70 factor (ECF subfamily)
MSSFPDTRASLIARIADAQDAVAWDEFARVYQPVVYRLARRRGLQHADAEEFVQEVMLAVARAVNGWVPDPERGRFRCWLHRIARNLMINFLTRPRHQPWSIGGSQVQRLLEAEPAADPAATESFDIEYCRELFRWAAERVQCTVSQNTWQAFWLSTIDDIPAGDVARRLGMTLGSVYIARSRVMARLRQEVCRLKSAEGADAAADAAPARGLKK